VPGENDSNGLPSYGVDNSAAARFLGQQSYGPPRATVRRRAAHHRDKGGLLDAVELGRGLRPRIVGERLGQAAVEVSLADSRHLTRISPDRERRRTDALVFVEQKKNTHASPRPRGQ
jgi:hypothetical protein